MASIRPVSNHLSCGVCRKQYLRPDHIPKILPCQHTFCLACLSSLERNSSSMFTECPICQSQHPGPPHDFTTNRALMDIAEELQLQASESLSCSTHIYKDSVLVCVDCLDGICTKCVKNHKDHQVEDLNDANTLLRQRLVDEKRKQQSILKIELASASSVTEITRAEDDVKELYTRLMSVLTEWQNDHLSILGEIKTKAAKREQKMKAKMAKLETMLQNETDDINTLIKNLREIDDISCQTLNGTTYNFVTAREKILADITAVIISEYFVKSKFLQDQTTKVMSLGTSDNQNTRVQWEFNNGQSIKEYHSFINVIIEKAYQGKESYAEWPEIDDKGARVMHRIDFITMKENIKEKASHHVDVCRKLFGKELRGSTWSPMTDSEVYKRVALTNTDPEYQQILQNFTQSTGGATNVIRIERIQNRSLYQRFVVHQQEMERINKANQKALWHGTSVDTIEAINAQGFNRSYCGKNAVPLGNGVYFVANANYAAQPQFARPDPSTGYKHMYLTQVLCGAIAKGAIGMRAPPVRIAPAILYDSVADNPNNPSIIVIFSDTQAYPEYLITFK